LKRSRQPTSTVLFIVLLLGPAVLLVGCAEELDEDTYVQVMIDQTELMFSEALDPEAALERAAEDNDTSLEAVEDFRAELEKDPDLQRSINDRINLALDEAIQPSLLPGQ
jgi:hypothetical protein